MRRRRLEMWPGRNSGSIWRLDGRRELRPCGERVGEQSQSSHPVACWEKINDNAGQLSKIEFQQKLSPTVCQASRIFFFYMKLNLNWASVFLFKSDSTFPPLPDVYLESSKGKARERKL